MTKYVEAGGITYHVDGKFHNKLNLFSVELSSQYSDCRFPDEKRKQFTTTLTREQLENLIGGLKDILHSSDVLNN